MSGERERSEQKEGGSQGVGGGGAVDEIEVWGDAPTDTFLFHVSVRDRDDGNNSQVCLFLSICLLLLQFHFTSHNVSLDGSETLSEGVLLGASP